MSSRRFDPRVSTRAALSTRSWVQPGDRRTGDMRTDVVLDCGWGQLLFGQTFTDPSSIVKIMQSEESGRRDIAMYLRDPHVLVAQEPAELFIDPSLTFRLWLHTYRPARESVRGVIVRKMRTQADADATNRIYAANGMVTADPARMWANQRTRHFTYLVAEDADTHDVIGTVTGVDHSLAFNDPESGSSLWCLAVDPQVVRPGVGEALVRTLAERFKGVARAYMDLSVLHDNTAAIKLYEKLGFVRVPVFAIKRKNTINEPLFAPHIDAEEGLNPYAQIVADEAHRRGIAVEVLDAEGGFLALSHGGRRVVTRESLSELTTAVAMSRCDDKRVTRRVLEEAGLHVARGRTATFDDADVRFLIDVGEVVVKPARGEQGQGITVGVKQPDALRRAVELARQHSPEVLLEEYVSGEDLRVIVIDHEVVAAAVRQPAEVVGDGRHSIRELIEKQSRRREAATGGESRIAIDEHTETTIGDAGRSLDGVLPAGESLRVRRTANLHTGGTMHDVTDQLHPAVTAACVEASRALAIPVVGLDLLVPDVGGAEHVFIEANERPGLANHEPQPTAEAFVDLLFPHTRRPKRGSGAATR